MPATKLCIVLMRHQPPQVADRFCRCRVGEVVISAITAAELEFGVIASGGDAERNREALEQFLLEVPVAPLDGLAAHALALGVTLVTNNPGDFQACPGLVIENWVA